MPLALIFTPPSVEPRMGVNDQKNRSRAPRRLSGSGGRSKAANEFHHLHAECVSALEAYIAEADKLCRMLKFCNGNAASATDQVDLVEQRQRETNAHAEYHRARKRLLRRARLSPTRKNLLPFSIAV